MNGADFLDVAKRLEDSPSEAERRTSIGRSYYALYNVLVALLSSQGVFFHRQGRDHRLLLSYLVKADHAEASLIAKTLRDLRTARNDADYRMELFVSAETSLYACRLARTEVDRLNALSPADREAMVRNIKGSS